METILTVSHKALGSLTATAAVRHFKSLLWCEVRRNGQALRQIVVSLYINVSDGSIDAKIEGDPNLDSLLINGKVISRSKQVNIFKRKYFGRAL